MKNKGSLHSNITCGVITGVNIVLRLSTGITANNSTDTCDAWWTLVNCMKAVCE